MKLWHGQKTLSWILAFNSASVTVVFLMKRCEKQIQITYSNLHY